MSFHLNFAMFVVFIMVIMGPSVLCGCLKMTKALAYLLHIPLSAYLTLCSNYNHMVLLKMLILLMLINILFADFEEPRSKLPVGYSSQSMTLTETFIPFVEQLSGSSHTTQAETDLQIWFIEVLTHLNITIAGYLKGKGSLWSHVPEFEYWFYFCLVV